MSRIRNTGCYGNESVVEQIPVAGEAVPLYEQQPQAALHGRGEGGAGGGGGHGGGGAGPHQAGPAAQPGQAAAHAGGGRVRGVSARRTW